MRRLPLSLVGLLICASAPAARAESIVGVCPDGSAFIVQKMADVPCARAKLVDEASDMPPLRPDLLPRPYTSQLKHQARDPNNPYNLLDAAAKVRRAEEAKRAMALDTPQVASARPVAQAGTPEAAAEGPLHLDLDQDEMRDLVRLVALRQELAPATFRIEDARGNERLIVRVAHSAAFEQRVLDALGESKGHVLLYSARSVRDAEFHPNFFLVHEGATFRPDPEDPLESGLIVGEPGQLEAGYLVLGYLVIPDRFDPATGLEVWWNDRSVHTILNP